MTKTKVKVAVDFAKYSDAELREWRDAISAELHNRSIKTTIDDWQKEKLPIAFP